MGTRGRKGMDGRTERVVEANCGRFTHFKLAPIARAIALTLAAGGAIGSGVNANAAQPFSAGWYGAMGVNQRVAATTGMVNGKPVSAFNPAAQQQAANTQLQQSIANLTLAAHGIAMMQAQQASWRKAALGNPSTIPNGLGVGGLDTGSLASSWINAIAPTTQTTDANGNIVVDIQQTADKAIANWQTFNIGKNTIVQFDQASADWAILNRIIDPLLAPSTIQGQIRAPGTVLIVNKNGIMFSGSSQVNVRNLVAAAADISDPQFQVNGIYSPLTGSAYQPAFTDAGGALIVEAGAQLNTAAPTSATQGGGYVLLMGQQVNNAGQITTQHGQAELAAGDNFLIRRGVGTDGNTAATTRGNEIAPQSNPGSTAGQVVNSGLLLAREGDITLAGHDVQQNGVAMATTTVNTRGTIHLLNSIGDATGQVTLGEHAVTVVAIEDDSQATALNSQRDAMIADSKKQNAIRAQAPIDAFDDLARLADRRDQSRIEIVSGGNVNFAGDSLSLATGGQITVSTTGSTLVADRAKLDVSGAVGVNLAMASNNISINVQGNELRDAPLNRDSGALFNNNVWIDARNLTYVPAGTDGYAGDRWYTSGGLLEVSGYLSNTGHGIGEWSAQGGTIQLSANAVTTEAGSQINLSGGSINVATGYINQTWLKGSDGQLYRVDDAPADMTFTGVYKGFEVTHPRWGVDATVSFYNPLIAPQKRLQNGYTIGRDAGELIVSAPNALMQGAIVANVFNGARQTSARPTTDAIDGYKLGQNQAVLPGSLAFENIDGSSGVAVPIDASVIIGNDAAPDGAPSGIYLNADALNGFNLGGFAVLTVGDITLDAPLNVAPGGAISLAGANVNINANADITARGGSIFLGEDAAVLAGLGSRGLSIVGTVTVAGGATLDTRGLWTNLLTDPETVGGMAFINGGKVTLQAVGDVDLQAGASIDASAGAAILSNGAARGGAGGDIALIAGLPLNGINGGGVLTLDGNVQSYGYTKGGMLSLQSGGAIVIGNPDFALGDTLAAGTAAPFDVVLSAPLTIAAGTPLPANSAYTVTSYPSGAPLPANAVFASGLPVQADWTVPDGAVTPFSSLTYFGPDGIFNFANVGDVIPSGSTLNQGMLPAGYVPPADVFRNGVPLNSAVQAIHPAGTVLASDVVFQAGTVLKVGTVLNQNAAIEPVPALKLATDMFESGFSAYSVNGESGLLVADGARITPTMQRFQLDASSRAARTGTNSGEAMSLYLAPVYTEDSAHAALTQRPGVDLNLYSGVDANLLNNAVGGSIVLGAGSAIALDPGATARLASGGQILVDGTITAPGGTIDILNVRKSGGNAGNGSIAEPGTLSVLIGSDAVLDVSARAYTALDTRGHAYGVVPDGGSIALGSDAGSPVTDAFIVIQPGAVIKAAGADAVIDLAPAGNAISPSSPSRPVAVASAGGSILLRTSSGIYNDGTLLAPSGGDGASGGALTIDMETVFYNVQPANLPPSLNQARVLTIDAVKRPSGADAGLVVGTAHIDAPGIEAGGFDVLSLLGGGGIAFDGDVTLNAGRSIALWKGALYDTVAGARVTLNAPYVQFNGQTQGPGLVPSVLPAFPLGGVFAVNADLVDLQNTVTADFADIRLASRGDIRFLPSTDTLMNPPTTILYGPGNIDLIAQQVYPTSNALVSVFAGTQSLVVSTAPAFIDPASVITIASVDGSTPAAPYSLFGQITFGAGTIRQGGVLRAPLGSIVLGSGDGNGIAADGLVELLPGSLTSVSAAGLTMPYGGTTDGVKYTVDGKDPITIDLLSALMPNHGGSRLVQGVLLNGANVISDAGSRLDLSGGGVLTGAAFVEGRGGSVDTLLHPLNKGGQVYAIVPGASTAPVAGGYATAWTGDVPGIGQQITVPAGVPGLPAGTYTLMPANYALLPGAYRVELGERSSSATAISGALATPDGSYLVSGARSIADTGIRDALSTLVTITPGAAVRTYSQYNEQGYDAFERAHAATFGAIRPLLPGDGKVLAINIDGLAQGSAPTAAPALTFDGSADFTPASGGYSGFAALTGAYGTGKLLITGPGSTALRTDTQTTVAASAINAIGASNLYLNAWPSIDSVGNLVSQFAPFGQFTKVELGPDATLGASQIIIYGLVELAPGAQINTLGRGYSAPDSSLGYLFGATLVASNGQILLQPPSGGNGVASIIGAGAGIYADGTVGFSGGVLFDGSPHIGARTVELAAGSINIGNQETLAAAAANGILPAGVNIDQIFLDQLLSGNPGVGAPAVESLVLGGGASINFYGSADLTTIDPDTGKSKLRQLQIYTPAIYGYGSAADVVNLSTDTLVWTGNVSTITDPNTGQSSIGSAQPGGLIPGGPGSGSGVFNINANKIVLGYAEQSQPNNTLTFDRLVLGFSALNLNAGESISANAKGNLAVYATGPDPSSGYNAAAYAGVGGTLNLVTPLLTGAPGSVMGYRSGGALNLTTPSGGAPATTMPDALGAEIDLAANTINDAGMIFLPSGKLTMTAAQDINLAGNARIDLSGQAIQFFDVTKYSSGGDLEMESAHGNIVQAAGSVIDLSAANYIAGTVKLTATDAGAGNILLGGTLLAQGGVGFAGGTFDIRAQGIGDPSNLSTDFAALNTLLDNGAFFGARSFDLKQGSLLIGAGATVKAHSVAISIDNGSLTVNGVIDASGAAPGTISLAAQGDLSIGAGAVLDARGTVLQADSYGQPINAANRATVELATIAGTLTLTPGATIDVSSPDPAAQGRINLNAPRTGAPLGASATGADAPANATATDIAISAAGPLNIVGAQSIALNGVASYSNAPADPNDANGQVITQAWLDLVDQDSQVFMNGALANGGLQNRLAGLTVYGAAFHQRPGVEIDSKTPDGNLTIAGDINLAGYRYGPGADRNVSSPTYGAGEPGSFVVRAGGNLAIKGSITDGFGLPPGVPSVVLNAGSLSADTVLPSNVILGLGTTFPSGAILPFDVTVNGAQLVLADTPVTTDVTLHGIFDATLGCACTIIFGGVDPNSYETTDPILVVSGQIDDPNWTGGSIVAGQYFQGTLGDGAVIHAGTVLRASNPAHINNLHLIGTAAQVPAYSTLPLAVILAGTNVLPNDVVVAGHPIVSGGTTYNVGATILAGTTLLDGTVVGAGNTLPFDAAIESMTWPAGLPFDVAGGYKVSSPLAVAAGAVIPAGTNIPATIFDSGVHYSTTWAVAPMLAAGTQSSSIRLVSGADTRAADTRALVAKSALAGGGNTVLNDPHNDVLFGDAIFSVIRTGTGDLELLSGGDFSEQSLYGIYTAGTQTQLPGGAAANAPFELPLALRNDGSGTVLGNDFGAGWSAAYTPLINHDTYYPDGGGNLLVATQGNLSGYTIESTAGVDDWLFHQGGDGVSTSWSVNFGTYVFNINLNRPALVGFTGFGALGGGNVTIAAGGNAGELHPTVPDNNFNPVSGGLVVAIGSSGRVTAVDAAGGIVTGGSLVQTGGGNLTMTIGGELNPGAAPYVFQQGNTDNLSGVFTNLRGALDMSAGAIGGISLLYGAAESSDPRPADPSAAGLFNFFHGAPVLVPGDSAMTLNTRGDLVLGGTGDAGMMVQFGNAPSSWFTLWRPTSSISLFSAGGNVGPIVLASRGFNDNWGGGNIMAPPSFSAVAASGSLYTGGLTIELAPSPTGQLTLLAQDSIYAGAYVNVSQFFGPAAFLMSGADSDPNAIPNPFKPGTSMNTPFGGDIGFFGFESDNATGNLHANDPDPIRVYAVEGDIVNLAIGRQTIDFMSRPVDIAAKPVDIRAGRDIVNFGNFSDVFGPLIGDILNVNDNDVSTISAGRDMFYTNVRMNGPGTLEVSAGRNLYLGDNGGVTSAGPLAIGDDRPGASIVMQAGVGVNGPDYAALAARYLDPANLADPTLPLAGQAGKVAKNYDDELVAWLNQHYDFSGTADDALGYFGALAPEQKNIFLRQVYYAELKEGGREFNNPDSSRFGSYLRGRDMIATLFPDRDAAGNVIDRSGDITMFGGSGVRTLFGGDIQMLAPGGQIVVGVQGEAPPSTSGVVTQGSGDIQLYSKGSVLLGLSRIMTTFGGDILAWSAEGDINAGRGSKTTLVYTPPKLVYDDFGNVTLAPDVPSTGAGIATLNPLPEVPAGDVDLIAPLGTIDVGEAGIRVSGNINLAALQVVNAANIVVKGKSTGVPTLAAVNVGALANAGAAASQAAMAAQDVVSRERNAARQALPSIFTVRVLSFGNEPAADEKDARPAAPAQQSGGIPYDRTSPVQLIGVGNDFDPGQVARLNERQKHRLQGNAE